MKYVGQIIFAGEAENLEDAREQAEQLAESIEGQTAVHVSDSLGGQFNPVHLLDAQSAFGHIVPEPPAPPAEAEAEEGAEPDVSGEE